MTAATASRNPAIDPALAAGSSTRPRRTSSVNARAALAASSHGKRKSRPTAASPVVESGRVTRRKAAQQVDNEPSRGEEENLNRYDYEGSKRSRQHSPAPYSASTGLSYGTWYGAAGPSTLPQPATNAQQNLDSASRVTPKSTAAAPTKAAPIKPIWLPYPIGLTPFRYPCLTPHLPPPPPGDPSNPAFRRYNPHEPQPTHDPPALDLAAPPQSQPVAATTGPQEPTEPNQSTEYNLELPMNDSDAEAYASLQALLSASQAYTDAEQAEEGNSAG